MALFNITNKRVNLVPENFEFLLSNDNITIDNDILQISEVTITESEWLGL